MQRVGRLAGRAAVDVARVVLDAGAEAHRLHHLQVVVRAHLQALRLQQLALLLELLQAFAQLVADGGKRAVHLRARGHVVRRGPDGQCFELVHHLAGDVVDLGDALYLVPPEVDAHRVVRIGREHVERVAAHAERAALELVVVAVVLDVDQLVDDVVAVHLLLLVHEHGHAGVVHGAADAVNAAHRRHHDAVAPRQQRRGGRMAQLLHFLVDGGVLLDERVGRRDVGFGLIVVVVADEVHHRVVRKELLELACQLGRKRLVRRHDQRGLLHGLDGLRHGERLAGSRHAQKRLVAQAFVHAMCQLVDGLRLVTGRLVGSHHPERRGGQPHLGQLALHLQAFDVRKMRHDAPSETEPRRRGSLLPQRRKSIREPV